MAEAQPITVTVEDDEDQTIIVDPDTGTVEEMQPDGGVIVRLDERRKAGLGPDADKWFRNLVDELHGTELSVIANDLIEGVKADDQSRTGKLDDIRRGLDLLGLQIQEPNSDVNDSGSGPQISSVTNPLLLEAVLKGWANAEAELLPASGPAKIKTDGKETSQEDESAETLERGINHYLTAVAVEYYPETSHMLLWGTYFGGSGFKKVYRCPMRRRPVAETVETKDLIVSNTSKDLRSCGRITHQIPMRPSVFKRMQLLGAYRKTSGSQPNPEPNAVDEKVGAIQGTDTTPSRPEDKPYTIWETQCELDLDDFIPEGSKFKGQGIPLPYLVTIDKDNEEVLAIRRDWDEDDEYCTRLRMYVRYPYIPGPGFYGTGMLNMLGNASMAMTAAWREALDAGMYANFPAGFMSKIGGRQINTDIKLGPGEWRPIETNGLPISAVISPNPYKDVTPGLMTLIDKITEQCRALGQGAELPAAEGLQNVPVGTMLAQVEQATKIMAAAHKGMHNAQSEELQLLVDLFKKHPDDLIRNGDHDSPFDGWDEAQLIQALNDHKLVPVSDPNVPSHIHRVAKALGLVQLFNIPVFAARLDPDEALKRVLAAMREDPNGLQVPAPTPQPQQDPEAAAKMVTAQAKMKDAENKSADSAVKASQAQMNAKQKSDELQTERDLRTLDVTKEVIIHQADNAKIQAGERKDAMAVQAKASLEDRKQAHQETMANKSHGLEALKAGVAAHDTAHEQKLGLAQHALEAEKAANEHALEVHKALNPPTPAPAAKPKPKK